MTSNSYELEGRKFKYLDIEVNSGNRYDSILGLAKIVLEVTNSLGTVEKNE